MAHLRQLLNILTNTVNVIEKEAAKQNAAYPSINDVFIPDSLGEQLASNPAVLEASALGASAASQLFATLNGPGLSVFNLLSGFHVSSAMRVATEAGVVELLRENPSGLSTEEIGKKTGTDPALMGRILRLLATHYVFREVEPDTFANNRISSIIDTGKPSELVIKLNKVKYSKSEQGSPFFKNIQVEKYQNTSGVAAVLEHLTDEGFKSSAFLAEYIFSSDKSSLPINRALGSPLGLFEYFEQPENKGYMARMQSAFEGASKLEPLTAILHGFDWGALPKSSLVVDLGGGNGSVSFCIAEAHPDLRFIVIDRPAVIENVTTPMWKSDPAKKKLLDEGRMLLQAHDFFQPQPESVFGKADIFLLRFIIHDWPNDICLKLLRHLHDAAKPNGRLIIVEHVVPYACSAPAVGKDIPGGVRPSPPQPLLSNLGPVNSRVHFADSQMMNILGAQERTLGEFLDLTAKAGWKIVKVYNPPGSSMQQLECLKY